MFLVHSRWNWNLEVLVLYERGKLYCPERILSEQEREPSTNSAHIQRYTWIRTWARKAIVKNNIIFSKLSFQFENIMYFLQWSIVGKRVLSPHVNTSFSMHS